MKHISFRSKATACIGSSWPTPRSLIPTVGINDLGVGQELPIHAVAFERNEMCFINDHEVKGFELASPLVDGLDAGHDHRMARVAPLQSRGVDAVFDFRTDARQL